MKELSIKEKAERYDEALEKVTCKYQDHDTPWSDEDIEDIFPELKESEDEKSKKWILEYLYDGLRKSDEQFKGQFKAAIAWLEKQDFNYTFEIKKGHWYKCVCDYMLNSSDLMFKNDRLYYCRSDWRLTGEIDERNVKNIGVNGYKSFFRPATNQEIKDWLEKQGEKKQELLTKEKALKNSPFVEQKPVDLVAILKDYFANTPKEQQDKDWEELKYLNNFGLEVVELEPAWGEYDCMMIESIIQTLEITGDKGANSMKINWLKDLKSRVQPQPRQEWSEEDEKLINRIEGWLDTLCDYLKDGSPECIEDVKDIIEHLKTLKDRVRPQTTWKPSEEQMKVLDVAIMNSHLTTAEYDGLVKLREQLKKLREE